MMKPKLWAAHKSIFSPSLTLQLLPLQSRICLRFNSTVKTDLPSLLQKDLVHALKAKDSFKATTIRSVLADITNLQKAEANKDLTSSQIVGAVRKAHDQRLNSAKQFEDASRSDLAEKERQEAKILTAYLPPLLPAEEIEDILRRIIESSPPSQNSKQAKGLIFKSFFAQVDRATVSTELVRKKLDALLS